MLAFYGGAGGPVSNFQRFSGWPEILLYGYSGCEQGFLRPGFTQSKDSARLKRGRPVGMPCIAGCSDGALEGGAGSACLPLVPVVSMIEMSRQPRQLHLGLFLFAAGYHPAGWRLPEARSDGAFDARFLQQIARKLERARFDFFFLGDLLSSGTEMQSQFPSQMVRLEPFTMLANVAAVTEKMGLVVTANTTYCEPYHIARMTASLDHLSGGRAAWNVVTGGDARAARNFGRDGHGENALRYARAEEFVQVVMRLWDSWEDDALVRDKATGRFVDDDKVHAIHHEGDHFVVEGPLNVARPPQGQVPLVSAGTSERSHEFCARFSNVVFTGQSVFEEARRFYADIKSRLVRHGRQAHELHVMPGLVPIVGATEAEARNTYRRLCELLPFEFDSRRLSRWMGVELGPCSPDDPVAGLPALTGASAVRPYIELARQACGRAALTLGDLFHFFAAAARGHLLVVGSAGQIADRIEEWFVNEAADGFNICPPYLPGGLDLFLEGVVPELQRRGLFREDYQGSTFREHFGLERPTRSLAR
ncbi:LLM class flavin-dependent oxidoreductase [Corallococcus sp. 4LFB]|uniref:LLM class flavin-dependent oxidoreductase n=1 Tax=Corallococcus sp. 4LFB TaxID=3383249 RepID=UPI003974C839